MGCDRNVSPSQMLGKTSAVAGIEKLLRENYSSVHRNDDENISGAIELLLREISDRKSTTQSILDETLRMIHRSFDFQALSIALRDRDHNFRYKAVSGLSAESKKTLLSICYSKSDLLDESTFPHTSISDITKFFMSENEPYQPEEVTTFFRPAMLSKTREHPDEMLSGDYIDFFFRNRSNEIIGFIEVGETRSCQLPGIGVIIWLELIATLLGVVLSDRVEE